MCQTIFVRVTDSDGNPRLDIEEKVFPSPEHFTLEMPTCTCWIGEPEGDGKVLRQYFVETVLQPMLREISFGNIVIELGR